MSTPNSVPKKTGINYSTCAGSVSRSFASFYAHIFEFVAENNTLSISRIGGFRANDKNSDENNDLKEYSSDSTWKSSPDRRQRRNGKEVRRVRYLLYAKSKAYTYIDLNKMLLKAFAN